MYVLAHNNYSVESLLLIYIISLIHVCHVNCFDSIIMFSFVLSTAITYTLIDIFVSHDCVSVCV